MSSKYRVITIISEPDIKGELIWAYIYWCFWDREIIFVKKASYVEQKSRLSSQAANLGYEIPALLYSLLKPTRTIIAKAIGREWKSMSFFNVLETVNSKYVVFTGMSERHMDGTLQK